MIKEKIKKKLRETGENIIWISVGSLILLILQYEQYITKRNNR